MSILSNYNPFTELTDRLDRIEELILSANSKKPEAQETLNLNQASKVCQISISRMYDLARKGMIPASRIGTRYVFIKTDLLNWLRTKSK
jgi:predicted DNA-binding transcriptional regulator AlpA